MEKHNEHITTYLDWYLDLDNPEFAFMVKGDWGTGKSFFIKEYQKEKHNVYKFVNITLNGVSSIEEISKQFLASYFPVLNSKYSNIIFNLVAGTANHFGYNSLLAKLKYRDFIDSINYNKEKKCIVVFDDFERHCFESHQTAMGLINTFIEKNKLNVIIISNEDEINKEKNDKYCRIKEKVIGHTLTIDTPLEYVFTCLLTEMAKDKKLEKAFKIIQDNYNLVFNIVEKSGYRNFRVLRQSIQNFGRLFDLIDKKYFDNHKFIDQLLPVFFALEIESRMGELSKDTFNEIEDGGYVKVNSEYFKGEEITQNMQKAHDLLNKYNLSTFINTWVFDLGIWRKWLFEGNVDKKLINHNLSKSYLFNNETCISKMIDWTDLPDDEFDEAIKEIIQKINDKELTNPSEIFLVYNRFLDFEEHDFDFSSYFTDNINKTFTEYLSSISKNDKLEEDYSFLHQGFEPKGNIEEYKKFKSDLINAIQQKTIDMDKDRAKTFLDVMKTDPKKAGDMIVEIVDERTKQPKRLFEFIDPKEFVDCYNNLENKNKRVICYKIEDRSKFIQNRDWLLGEKKFIKDSIKHIKTIVKTRAYFPSIFYLEQLKIVLEKNIEVMSEYENKLKKALK